MSDRVKMLITKAERCLEKPTFIEKLLGLARDDSHKAVDYRGFQNK